MFRSQACCRARLFITVFLFGTLSVVAGCGGNASSPSPPPPPIGNPVPSITSLSPTSAPAGAAALTLTVNGSNFIASSQVSWNGSPRTTSFKTSSMLTAEINATDVGSQGTAAVTVSNPAPGGGTSNPTNFQISAALNATANFTVIPLQGNDLVWDAQRKKIYVSVTPSSANFANSVATVDPVAGVVNSAHSAGGNGPSPLAISDDDQFLYVGYTVGGSLQRFALNSFAPNLTLTFGTDPSFHQLYYAGDIKVAPGLPHTFAVSRWLTNVGPRSSGVIIYDDGTARSNIATPGTGTANSIDSIQWKPDATAIYAQDTEDTGLNFYVLSVNSSGVSQVMSFGSRFRYFGNHLHLDPAKGFVYSDAGEVLDPTSSLPVGLYPVNPSTNVPQTLAVVDPALSRVFFLTQLQGLSGNSFQIDVFDQTHFTKLGSLIIPNAAGLPANFIRWGNAGLAFVTNDPSVPGSQTGNLYLLDGLFVNPSGVTDSMGGSSLNPLPTITSINPPSIPVGSAATPITVNGLNFGSASVALWNGQALPTTFINTTQLQFVAPTASLSSPASTPITITNPSPGGGTSNSIPLTVDPIATGGTQIVVFNAGGNDLVWNPQRQTLYVSVPAVNTASGNTILSVDPVIGPTNTPAFVGSEPAKLSLSGDGQFLYVGMNGSNSVQQMALPAITSAAVFHLGANDFSGPFYPLDMKVAPGSPHTLAVTRGSFNNFPAAEGGIAIYDDSTVRPTLAPGFGTAGGNEYDDLEWGPDITTLFAAGENNFFSFTVNQQGVTLNQSYQLVFPVQATGIHFDSGTGLIYADTGQVLNPATGKTLNTIGASGLAIPDSTLNRVYFLGQTLAQVGTANYTIESFNKTTLASVSSLVVENVVGVPTAFVRWGSSGLAFTTAVQDAVFGRDLSPGRLYVVSGGFVTMAANEARQESLAPHVQKTWGNVRNTIGTMHR